VLRPFAAAVPVWGTGATAGSARGAAPARRSTRSISWAATAISLRPSGPQGGPGALAQ